MDNKITCHFDPYEEKLLPVTPNTLCVCNRPMWIVIPAGQHMHLCTVHPDKAFYGSSTFC